MNVKSYIKNNYIQLSIISIISLLVSFIFLKETGIKDGVMILLSTFFLLLELYLIKEDKKKSLLLFMISFPIMVTARKICYFDFLFVKVTYETIYITCAFLFNIKSIVGYINNYTKKKKGFNYIFLMFIIILVVFAINSSFFSPNILGSLSDVYISIIIPIMFMLTIIVTFDSNHIIKIFYALIIGLDLSCIYGFVQIVTGRIPFSAISNNRDIITFGYHNINIFAQILMLIVPLLLELMLYNKNSKKEKIFLYTSFAVILLALFITYTRGAWLCFIITFFIMLISKRYRKIVYALLIGFLIIAKPLLNFILSRGTSTGFMKDESTIARIQAIFTSFKLIFEYPFGIGGGNFAVMYKKYSDVGYMLIPHDYRVKMTMANYAMENAHNLFLQVCVEYGIVFAVAFLIILINRIILALKNFNVNRGVFSSMIIYFIFSILTGVEFDHKGIITGTLIIWIIMAIIQINNKEGMEL